MRSPTVIALALALSFLHRSALAAEQPEGWERAKFGISIEKLGELYPDAKRAGGSPLVDSAADEVDEHGHKKADVGLVIFRLDGQKLDDLQPCSVRFRFAWDYLYHVGFDCGRGDGVVKYLEGRFGQFPSRVGHLAVWHFEDIVVTLNTNVNTFSFAERQRSQQVSQTLLHEIVSGKIGAATAPQANAAENEEPAAATGDEK